MFRGLDTVLLTSVSRVPENPVRDESDKFLREIVGTLTRRGNVLIPIQPTGRIYDLFEAVLGAIENEKVLVYYLLFMNCILLAIRNQQIYYYLTYYSKYVPNFENTIL